MTRMNWGAWNADSGLDSGTRFAEALTDFDGVLKLNPSMPEAWVGRGVLAWHLVGSKEARGEDPGPGYARAIADCTRALALNPACGTGWLWRGGDDPTEWFAAAEKDLERSLSLNRSEASTWRELGSFLSDWADHLARRGGDPFPLFARAVSSDRR